MTEPSTDKTRITVPAEEAYALQRIKVLQDVQDELLRWIKHRFWVVALLLAVLGFFGVNQLARVFIEKELVKAQTEVLEAVKAAALAKKATDDAGTQTETYARTVGDLQSKAQAVDGQFLQVRQRIEEDSRNVKVGAQRDAQVLTDRVVRLEQLVGRVADASRASQEAVDAYRKDISAKQAAAQTEAKRFAENSEYRVTVYFGEIHKAVAARAVDTLAAAGFKASSSPLSFSVAMPTFGVGLLGSELQLSDYLVRVNTIRYSADASPKVETVRNLLAPLVRVKATEEFSLSTSGKLQWILARGLILVYLVD
jgi:hypothetical protein